jgi:hypothetical protein
MAHESPPETPGWVKAFGIVLVVLLLYGWRKQRQERQQTRPRGS